MKPKRNRAYQCERQIAAALIGQFKQQRPFQEQLLSEVAGIRNHIEVFLNRLLQTFGEQESNSSDDQKFTSNAPDEGEDVLPETHSIAEILMAIQRSQNRIESGYVQRQVSEPIFRQLLPIYTTLSKQKDVESLSWLLDEFQKVFEGNGLMVIHPSEGTKFNPKKHHPICKSIPKSSALAGSVSETYVVGLESDQRIIQTARVAIYDPNFNQEKETK